ncbi:unnamed protein product [Psylliodes chrysocephalus]|uniref:Protein I'm not dead yet n=1 Tax=Psylliodes chrysocephalus TaxID=3402493 RepID=A0A9P0D0E7_9CUCU|nr:unnamed protein product [Psylliodes chrysocephala]
MWRFFEFFVMYWRITFLIVYPIVTLPIIFVNNIKPFRCLYCFGIMCALWMTEAIPPAITSILPIPLFSLMGVQSTDEVAHNYMNDTNMMLIGSVAIAIAMENSGLHIRIALGTIKCIGCSLKKLHVGLGMVTMFISMWIANTAATALMIPIVEGTLLALEREGLINRWYEVPGEAESDWRPTRITKCYYISIAYCSLLGGTGCIIGSGSHLAFKGIYEKTFPTSPGVEFAKWMMFNVPVMLISNVLMIIWLQILYMGMFRPKSEAAKQLAVGIEAAAATKAVIDKKIEDLGPMSFKEFSVAICFIMAIVLWFFRRPGFMKGWPLLITDEKCGDAVVAITVFVLFFLIPIDPGCLYFFSSNEEKRPTGESPGILTWKVFTQKMHWNMVLVLGGGFAMADAAKKSGMAIMVAEYFVPFLSKTKFFNMLVFCGTGSIITQFLSSNVACVTILTPIVLDMCVVSKIHPMYLGLSTALACCYSYFLPVSTPPNALVAGPSRMGAKDMMVSGSGSFVVCLSMLVTIFPVYSPLIWDFEFPDWAAIENVTTISPKATDFFL